MEDTSVLLICPDPFDSRTCDLIEKIRQQHKEVHVSININDRKPTLYSPHERHAIAGWQQLRAAYYPSINIEIA